MVEVCAVWHAGNENFRENYLLQAGHPKSMDGQLAITEQCFLINYIASLARKTWFDLW
jgi:hypothetical protein